MGVYRGSVGGGLGHCVGIIFARSVVGDAGVGCGLFIRAVVGRFGVGVDVWSWKYRNTKLEVDYDALIASEYTQNVISGKITVRF